MVGSKVPARATNRCGKERMNIQKKNTLD